MANVTLAANIGTLPQSGGSAAIIFSDVKIGGLPQTYDFNGTVMKFTGNDYRLSIVEGAGITISAGVRPTIFYHDIPIGTATTVSPRLVVQFNHNATAAAIEALADRIALAPAGVGSVTAPHYDLTLDFADHSSAALPYVVAEPGTSTLLSERTGGGILVGSTGNDTFEVNIGSIVFLGGDGSDTLYLDHASNELASLDLRVTAAQQLGAGGPTVTLSSVENVRGGVNLLVTGTDAANAIFISAGEVHALGGDDMVGALRGGGLVDGGSGSDTLVVGGGDYDLRLAGVQNGMQLISIENVTSTEAGIDDFPRGSSFIGTDGPNRLSGGAGDDQLVDNGGADVLAAGSGTDHLDGGFGDDILIAGLGHDMLIGGPGVDTVDLSGINKRFGAIVLDLNLKGEQATGPGIPFGFTLSGVENVIGNDAANTFYGSFAPNRLEGRDGRDTLSGRGGDDVLDGGAGDDNLNGGAGDDVLIGGAGVDKMRGGDGDDIFRFLSASDSPGPSGSRDIITDFDEAGDRLDLSALAVGGGALTFIGSAPFHHEAGEVRYVTGASSTFVAADLDGDGTPDFQVTLAGLHTLNSANFDLI